MRDEERWCLWMELVDPKDIATSPVLRERVAATKGHREKSLRPATRELARIPYLFAERRQPRVDYLCLPSVVSETRPYFTAQRFSPEIVASNLVFTVPDPEGLQFALASSSMFITWQKTVGGRLKSYIRFSATLTWNTFPVPELGENLRAKIIKAGQSVLAARELHPERSLAQHYIPLAMDPVLVKAHDALDREVDKVFGASRKLTTERQRQEILFANYSKLTYGSSPN